MNSDELDTPIQLSLFSVDRVPEELRLDPETCRRGRLEIERLRRRLESRRLQRAA